MSYIADLLSELSDTPDEHIAVALADAVFTLTGAADPRFDLCLAEADRVRARLKLHGFDIVKMGS